MRRIVDAPKKSPLVKFYESRGVQWDKLIDCLDFFFYTTHLPKRDILHTATVVAGEYVANGLGKTGIPASVLARLEKTVDFYETVPDEAFEVALILPKPGLMSPRLIPVALYNSRAARERAESMDQFAHVCVIPRALSRTDAMMAHAHSMAELLVREGTAALPRTLGDWIARAQRVCALACMVIKPLNVRA